MQWSNYQNAVFERIKTTDENLWVSATAGSGKSSTIFEAIRQYSKHRAKPLGKPSVRFLSFNKIIQEHANNHIGSVADCSTFHALGFKLIRNAFGNSVVLDDQKVLGITKGFSGDFKVRQMLAKTVNSMKSLGIVDLSEENLAEFIVENPFSCVPFNLNTWEKNVNFLLDNINTVKTIFTASDLNTKLIDFNDMVRFPAIFDLVKKSKTKSDLVTIDEAQDINSYQVKMINQLQENGSRIILVGDALQSIYAFRGSVPEQILTMVKEGFTSLPLSTSYRCKSNIVDFVNSQIPESVMQANSQGGSVQKLPSMDTNELCKTILDNNIQIVICAKNKPLLKIWTRLFKSGIPSTLKQTNIVNRIEHIINDNQRSKVPFHIFLNSIEEASKKLSALQTKNDDILDCVLYLSQRFNIHDYVTFKNFIKNMAATNLGITLHTVHSAKGLEAKKVVVIEDWFDTPQLENMRYVAYTRASDNLYLSNPI